MLIRNSSSESEAAQKVVMEIPYAVLNLALPMKLKAFVGELRGGQGRCPRIVILIKTRRVHEHIDWPRIIKVIRMDTAEFVEFL